MGRRSHYANEHREWITDQLLRSGDAPRSPDFWRALHVAFLEQFPGACDSKGDPITRTRYRKFAVYIENRQETSLVSRVAAHLRRHELLQQDQKALAETRTQPSEADRDQSDEGMEDVDMTIKSEVVDHSDDGDFDFIVVPRAPVPLLRTRATATAIRADQEHQADAAYASSTASTVPTPTPSSTPATARPRVRREKLAAAATQAPSGVPASSTTEAAVAVDPSRKRPRIETVSVAPEARTAVKAKPSTTLPSTQLKSIDYPRYEQLSHCPVARTEQAAIEMEMEKASHSADALKTKYEAEKAKKEDLQARLSEALTLLSSQGKQLERLEATIAAMTRGNAASSSTSTANASALTFTISVNVDVSQNGQRLRTTTHALRVDADANADATSQG